MGLISIARVTINRLSYIIYLELMALAVIGVFLINLRFTAQFVSYVYIFAILAVATIEIAVGLAIFIKRYNKSGTVGVKWVSSVKY